MQKKATRNFREALINANYSYKKIEKLTKLKPDVIDTSRKSLQD